MVPFKWNGKVCVWFFRKEARDAKGVGRVRIYGRVFLAEGVVRKGRFGLGP